MRYVIAVLRGWRTTPCLFRGQVMVRHAPTLPSRLSRYTLYLREKMKGQMGAGAFNPVGIVSRSVAKSQHLWVSGMLKKPSQIRIGVLL